MRARVGWSSERVQGHSGDFWTLERCQHFIEPGVPSWEAFAAGEWERALELAEEQRPALREYIAANRHLNRRRVRIVEHPLTPYLQWELHVLRLRVLKGTTSGYCTPMRFASTSSRQATANLHHSCRS